MGNDRRDDLGAGSNGMHREPGLRCPANERASGFSTGGPVFLVETGENRTFPEYVSGGVGGGIM